MHGGMAGLALVACLVGAVQGLGCVGFVSVHGTSLRPRLFLKTSARLAQHRRRNMLTSMQSGDGMCEQTWARVSRYRQARALVGWAKDRGAWISEKIELKDSIDAGRGFFARSRIAEGEDDVVDGQRGHEVEDEPAAPRPRTGSPLQWRGARGAARWASDRERYCRARTWRAGTSWPVLGRLV